MAAERPHILIFNPDQWRGDVLGHVGNAAAVTPNLDGLVQADAAGLKVTSSDPNVPVDVMVKRHGGGTYVFAVSMRPGSAEVTFELPRPKDFVRSDPAAVIGEDRSVEIRRARFTDRFDGYQVHIYKVIEIPGPRFKDE
ncbi:MAG TPA: hypothetical protein VNA25_25510 [Phycisphaerae bacterium]|nr:hypothetical protein [Phycisphaerae bacterium]